ncbi:hypothetical protein [Paremcibacter congregatus]|uniref:hypothetical protein n=1 Tax=Paremcibacter congregatus TaxID=2043170 RepID=UPI0030EE43C9|tara:strand:- start:179 stop:1471 length:1293 start_codon:yes stop_codon:yes gene_type:complete
MISFIKNISNQDTITVFIIFILVFICQSKVAVIWSSYGVFDQYNVIFDTDPNTWKANFSNGWSVGSFNHPLLTYFFSLPLRALSAIASFLGLIENQEEYREAFAIYVAPVCTALKAVCFYLSFRLLKLGPSEASLATGFAVLGFSSVVFGATPSSYAVTGFGLVLSTLLALSLYVQSTTIKNIGFIISGIFLVGITSSNIIQFGWMVWLVQSAKSRIPLTILGRSIAISSMVFSATIMLYYTSSITRGVERNTTDIMVSSDFVKRYTPNSKEQVNKLIHFPELIARTFIATTPTEKENSLAIQHNSPIKFELTYTNTGFGISSFILSLVSIVVVCGGATIAYRQGGLWQQLSVASMASLFSIGLLYSLFGINMFLYSQTWYIQCVFLISAWLKLSFFKTQIGRISVGFILLMMTLGDLHVLTNITQQIIG